VRWDVCGELREVDRWHFGPWTDDETSSWEEVKEGSRSGVKVGPRWVKVAPTDLPATNSGDPTPVWAVAFGWAKFSRQNCSLIDLPIFRFVEDINTGPRVGGR
jgi:hypothetical protein